MEFNITDVGLRGRGNAAIQITELNDVVITSDIIAHNLDYQNTTISLSESERNIKMLSDTIELFSNLNDNGTAESIVLGESLVTILRWFIHVMLTHTHPPNAPPVNTFFDKAREYHRDMENIILNKNVKTK